MTNETREKINKMLTTKNIAIAAAILLVVSAISFYSMGWNAKISDEILAEHKEQDAVIADKNNTISKLEEEIKNNKDEIESQEADFKELEDYKANKAKLDAETKELEKNIETLNNTVSDKQKEIDSKNSELASLTDAVIKAKAAPVTLPAGQFTVGKDIQPGRYSVSGDSNFVVYSSDGDLKVNTILGGGKWGVESYICELENGYKIEANASNKYTPVE